MKSPPTVNAGIVATNVSAKAIAIGPGATANNTEHVSGGDLHARLEELRLLVVDLRRTHPDLPEAKVAESLLNKAATTAASKDKKTFGETVQSIVSIFKAVGDTVSTSQKIVDTAQGILNGI